MAKHMPQHNTPLVLAVKACRNLGLVGEDASVRLVYLVLTSRLLPHPVNAVIKGPAGAGKSHLVNTVLRLMPDGEYITLTGASPKVLFRAGVDLRHKALVLQEAVFGRELEYVLRTLISEGRLEYQTIVSGEATTFRAQGPVAFLTTTTRWQLEPELETRLLDIPVATDAAQTRAVLMGIAARRAVSDSPAVAEMQDFQRQLSERLTGSEPVIPYATKLAELMPMEHARIRRDFAQLLALIRSHTILSFARRKMKGGALVATIDDYRAVYNILSEIGQRRMLSLQQWQRDLMAAVANLRPPVTVTAVAAALGWSVPTTWRRVKALVAGGHLANATETAGESASLYVRAELAANQFPDPARL